MVDKSGYCFGKAGTCADAPADHHYAGSSRATTEATPTAMPRVASAMTARASTSPAAARSNTSRASYWVPGRRVAWPASDELTADGGLEGAIGLGGGSGEGIGTEGEQADFAGSARGAAQHLALDDQAHADAGADGEEGQRPGAAFPADAAHVLAVGGEVAVVVNTDRDAELFEERIGERGILVEGDIG